MCFWIEMRCIDRDEDHREEICVSCLSAEGELCGETVKDVIEAKRTLERVAKESGWKKTSNGWVCSECFEARQEIARVQHRTLHAK